MILLVFSISQGDMFMVLRVFPYHLRCRVTFGGPFIYRTNIFNLAMLIGL